MVGIVGKGEGGEGGREIDREREREREREGVGCAPIHDRPLVTSGHLSTVAWILDSV